MRIIYIIKYYLHKYFKKEKFLNIPVLDFRMWVDSNVDGISLALAKYGERELDMLWLVKKYVKPGMKILDLGGNIGYYSIIMSRIVGGTGKVYVVEPDPRNITLLKRNINKYSNSILYECAIGDKDMDVEFNITEKSNLNTFVKSDSIKTLTTKEVKMYKLETFVKKVIKDQISFIRMDIEGFEFELLREAFSFLNNYSKPLYILFETHPNYYSNKRDMGRLIIDFLENKFNIEYMVSAGDMKNKILDKYNLNSEFDMKSDNYLRSFYNKPNDNGIIREMLMNNPKMVRYILISKK